MRWTTFAFHLTIQSPRFRCHILVVECQFFAYFNYSDSKWKSEFCVCLRANCKITRLNTANGNDGKFGNFIAKTAIITSTVIVVWKKTDYTCFAVFPIFRYIKFVVVDHVRISDFKILQQRTLFAHSKSLIACEFFTFFYHSLRWR